MQMSFGDVPVISAQFFMIGLVTATQASEVKVLCANGMPLIIEALGPNRVDVTSSSFVRRGNERCQPASSGSVTQNLRNSDAPDYQFFGVNTFRRATQYVAPCEPYRSACGV